MKSPLGCAFKVFFLLGLLLQLAGCSGFRSAGSPVPTLTPLMPAGISEPTAENYISGEEFCRRYAGKSAPEYGRWINVPRDYADSTSGEILVYAWTAKKFDPELPSFVIVDGGPGQNTHGIGSFFDDHSQDWNEIHFDQRGLGCSAAQSYEEYRDVNLYSTENTIKDMDLIRKHYQLETWSVYGVSYGTVPATRYANLFPEATKTIVLEGVVYDSKNIHASDWYAEKLNLVLDQLSEVARDRFHLLMADAFYSGVFKYIVQRSSRSGGENQYEVLQTKLEDLLSQDLSVVKNRLENLTKDINAGAAEAQNEPSQIPMGIDYHVHRVIYCKELNGREDLPSAVYNVDERKYIQGEPAHEVSLQDCRERGVEDSDEEPYIATDYPVSIPITYFQGTHDNATLARGALLHWQGVPLGQVQMLLNQKGGHNPMLTDLFAERDSEPPGLPEMKKVLAKALLSLELIDEDLFPLNQVSPLEQQWLLFKKAPVDLSLLGDELNGIGMLRFFRENFDQY